MIDLAQQAAPWMALAAVVLAALLMMAVVGQRIALAAQKVRLTRLAARYNPLLRRALTGDHHALRALAASPARYRITIGTLLISPLIDDRNPVRIAATRSVVDAMSLLSLADQLLRSRRWWDRALAVRALGLIQQVDRADRIVAALDDPSENVRSAALNALADMKHPATLEAVVVRLNDTTLHPAARIEALVAFGTQAEPFVLQLAQSDLGHRTHYARALAICGTDRSRSVLCEWMDSPDADVRTAALGALSHVGLDASSAALAVRALDGPHPAERAAAAGALRGWIAADDAVVRLARRLDDTWVVAARAARTLQTMGLPGQQALEASAARTDLAGALARQMLWESRTA